MNEAQEVDLYREMAPVDFEGHIEEITGTPMTPESVARFLTGSDGNYLSGDLGAAKLGAAQRFASSPYSPAMFTTEVREVQERLEREAREAVA